MTDLVLAWAMVTAPAESVEPVPPPDRWPAVSHALREVVVLRELYDRRELPPDGAGEGDDRWAVGGFTCRENFPRDLAAARDRYRAMEATPPLSDAGRFPPPEVSRENVHVNRRYRDHLEVRLRWEYDRQPQIRADLAECNRRYVLWDRAWGAAADTFYVPSRRLWLAELKALLGPDDYAAGRLPPPVPFPGE